VPVRVYTEYRVATAPEGGEVRALSVEPEAALLEYLDLSFHLGRAGRALERIGAIDFTTTVAPGLRDVLLTGKVYEAVTRRDTQGRRRYDAVVLDAPPTGRITRFLNVSAQVVGLARMGPIRQHATSIMELLRSPETAVHLVTLWEEMPVQETADAVVELRAAGLQVGGVVVNQVRRPELTGALPGPAEVVAGLRATGWGGHGPDGCGAGGSGPPGHAPGGSPGRLETLAEALLRDGAEQRVRWRLEEEQDLRVTAMGRPVYRLPELPDGVDHGALYELAGLLREQGLS
jgi:anion-transporting  ArsA/GET3 family ATPase